MKAHHHDRPALTVTTEAPGATALDVLVDHLVAARLRPVRRDAGSATLQIGTFLRSWMFSDTMLLDVVPPLRPWGMLATVDLAVLDGPPTRVRVAMRKVSEHRETVPHVLAAIEAAGQVLEARSFATEIGEVGHGP